MAGEMVDTAILVDALRGDGRARSFLDGLVIGQSPVCPDVVLAELIVGCPNRSEIRKVKAFVHDLFIVELHDHDDSRVALEMLEQYHPSHGLGYHDCLIAAMVVNRKTLLYTPNLKHMHAVEGLKLRKPY
jgi:predicted nucleic acid-binding protein